MVFILSEERPWLKLGGEKKRKHQAVCFLQLLFPIVDVTIIFTYEERLKWSRDPPYYNTVIKKNLKERLHGLAPN